MLMTGDFINTDKVVQFGLINAAVSADELDHCEIKLANTVVEKCLSRWLWVSSCFISN